MLNNDAEPTAVFPLVLHETRGKNHLFSHKAAAARGRRRKQQRNQEDHAAAAAVGEWSFLVLTYTAPASGGLEVQRACRPYCRALQVS